MKILQSLFGFFALLISFSALSIALESAQSRKTSDDFSDKKSKIAFLRQHVQMASPIQDALFDIYNVNLNPRGIPGASNWDYKLILKVDPAHFEKWAQGYTEIRFQEKHVRWAYPLIQGKPNWQLKSIPKAYQRDNSNSKVFLYSAESLVLKRFKAN